MRDYSKLAPLLNLLITKPDSEPRYELFADALVWTDELPPVESLSDSLVATELRGIWHFRTSLILGNPVERFRPAWEEAHRCFPNWPGFDPKRREASWAPILLAMRDEAMAKFEEFENRADAELARKAVNVG